MALKKLFLFLGVCFLLGIFFTACGGDKKQQPQVVVYTSVDQVFSEPILKDFEKQTGIKVLAVYDTEETKSTGVLNRLIAEKDNPQCDVFWSGDPVRTVILKERHMTEPYRSKVSEDIPEDFKDKDGHWTGFSARARVLIFNKKLMQGKKVPESIFDLINPAYKGKFAIANPLFGTTTFHIAALFSVLGHQKAKQFLQDLKKNQVIIATSNGDVKKRTSQGQILFGLTDTDDAFSAIKEGEPVDFVFLDQKGIGTLVMPNTVCLIKGGPNTDNGKRLIDYLLSRDTEKKLALSAAQMPLHKGVETPDYVVSIDKIKAMKIDYEQTAKIMEEIQPFLKKWTESH